MSEPKTFPNGRPRGLEALTRDEHEWLLQAVPSGLVSKIEAAAKLGISLPTVEKWLTRPVGFKANRGRARKGAA